MLRLLFKDTVTCPGDKQALGMIWQHSGSRNSANSCSLVAGVKLLKTRSSGNSHWDLNQRGDRNRRGALSDSCTRSVIMC